MRIRSIHFKNGYKRFFDLTIDLGNDPKRIIALVGSNGCGKSSVFDGMLYLAQAYGNSVGNVGSKDDNYHSMNKNKKFDFQDIIIEFVEGNYYNIFKEKEINQKEKTIFSIRSPYRYNSNLKVQESRATSEIRLNNYGATTLSDLDDKMEENYRRLNIKYNKYLNDKNCRPTEAKAKIIGDLNNALKNCLDLQIDNLGNIESNEGTIYFKKDDHPSEFEFNVLSSGEKEVVDILLDLYIRQDEYDDSVFIIDEPELHINTAIQRKLLIEINKLIGDNCQIWIATHSIGFLRALQEDLKDECDIIYFKSGEKWASEKQTLEPIKKSVANWKKIFKTALDDLTGLISPKRLIYCEGRDKLGSNGAEKGFDATVFNNIFGEKYHDTLFISSGGNTELDQRSEIAIMLLSKVFSDIQILVLKDRDMASGKTTTEQDRQLYLKNNPPNHRVLKRREIENYLFDKEVLKKYCEDNSLVFNEEKYNQTVTDINNQNLKDITGRIKQICSITVSINPQKFKESLSQLITEEMGVFKEFEEVIFHKQNSSN